MNPASPPFSWPYAAMLALSLTLGLAIAAGADAWGDRGSITAAGVLADCAAPLLIAAAMAVFARLTHLRLFAGGATTDRAAHDTREALK